ncbi:MAG TPA: tol-pal system protein YbgF [Nitrospira sp.]|nr:tol-pal system protein YbgF [Nitrospira sp.]
MHNALSARSIGTLVCLLSPVLLYGCMAQQADLKQTEKNLQQRIKQSNEELAQTRARQSQEISTLREQELPQLRGELERAQHQEQEILKAQDDLKQRSAVLEQQTKKLELLASRIEGESTTRYAQVRESLNAQDVKNKTDRDQLRMDVNTRLDDVNRQMELLRKEIIDVVQKANSGLAKSMDVKLDEQRKALADSQARTEQLSAKFTQFSQALTGFRDSLTSLGERVGQEEQANKALAAKVESDTKASTAHINETTKAMSGHLSEVNKSVTAVAQKLATRLDEQDRRLDLLGKSVDQVAQEVHLRGANPKAAARQQTTKSAQRSSFAPTQETVPHREAEQVAVAQDPEPSNHATERPAAAEESAEPPPAPAPTPAPAVAARPVERSDKVEYDRLLAFFKEGNLEESRQGFSAFLAEYPNSDLAPNARYWLGESHYGKKDYKQAIDSYDRVELDYPQSEKVPAAILKKGFAYLALKDKKRASSAFKQVVTLYPKSPEAGKAYDKLNQLKESR